MPDIAMCNGVGCNLKENCYRFKAVPNEYYQSYFMGSPYDTPDSCVSFWPEAEKKKERKKRVVKL